MTNPTTHGQVPAIQRYKIGYHSDEWGVRSSTPGGISDPSGQWVLYKDYIAALVEAQQPAPSGAVALSDYLRDRLVAISEAIADQDDRAAQAMLREILAAPQPSPTPQPSPASQVDALDAERYRWLRERMLGIDFDWNESGITALSFEMPEGCAYGGCCNQNIDAAMNTGGAA